MVELLFAFALQATDYQVHCYDRATCPIPAVLIEPLTDNQAGSFTYLQPLVLRVNVSNKDDELKMQTVLVHEFVHYLQWRAGKFTPATTCRNKIELEREAYKVASAYLATKGVMKDYAEEMFAVSTMCPADE